jgi:hypothetical protein
VLMFDFKKKIEIILKKYFFIFKKLFLILTYQNNIKTLKNLNLK